jgi:hypothetical protein
MSEYDEHAAALLKEMGVTFEVRRVGNACPRFCTDQDDMSEAGKFPRKKHIHGDQHLCILRREVKAQSGAIHEMAVSFDFWNSYRDQLLLAAIKGEAYVKDAPWNKSGFSRIDFIGEGRRWAMRTKFSPLPTAYSLLACLQKSDVSTFKDFCSDFGYSDDSIRALETYRAVQEEFEKVRRFFTAAELEQLQDIA